MKLKLVLVAALLASLTACEMFAPQPEPAATETPSELGTTYRALAQHSPVYEVQASSSKVRIYVFRGGKAAKLGHNHVLSAPKFEGFVVLPSQQPAEASFELRVPVAELVVDDPALRAKTGGSFSGNRSPSEIEGTRRNMLGEHGFDAERYPSVRLRSTAIEGDWPVLIAQVEVSMHGVTRTQPVLLRVQHDPDQIKVTGSLVLRQSDFGMKPFSVLGGLMAVQDAVAIDFELLAKSLTHPP